MSNKTQVQESDGMMSGDLTKISKFLSLVLRHKPEEIGIQLDEAGWVNVEALLAGCHANNILITRELLEEVVNTSEKKRFAFDDSKSRIRASQGHSIQVELGYQPAAPPEFLFHGTVEKFLSSIFRQGLVKGDRHHVHLSADEDTAIKVGQRRGRPVVLRVNAGKMQMEGHAFYRSENGVWLTEHVPTEYLERI